MDQGLSPLHIRVMALIEQLPNKNYNVCMDNLYISLKLALFSKNGPSRCNIYGVARENVQGIPSCILKNSYTKNVDIINNRGTLKVSELKG